MGKLFERKVQAGRVCYVAHGNEAGKLVTIVDIVDQNRALIDGPTTGVKRQLLPLKCLHLTQFVLPLPHGSRSKVLRKVWEKEEIDKKWSETSWAKKLQRKTLRANMTDYDRFSLMVAKQKRAHIVNTAFGKLRKANPRPAQRKPNKKLHRV